MPQLDQRYGDVPGVLDVSYSYDARPDVWPGLFGWHPSGTNLPANIGYGASSSTNNFPVVALRPLNGQVVSISGLSLVTYTGLGPYASRVTVSDGYGNPLYQSGDVIVNDRVNLSFSAASNSGLSISWSGNGSVAIQDINYQVAQVPEPETYAMMLLGLPAILVAAKRRKRRAGS